jgi:hypothetical protein
MGGIHMQKKIGVIIILILLIMTLLPITTPAGDPENPEITDEQGDVYGTLITNPFITKLLILFGIVNVEFIDSIDILSAWFYEQENESEYLFITIKTKNLEFSRQREAYTMIWMNNGTKWIAYFNTYSKGEVMDSTVGDDINTFSYEIESRFNVENNTVTFKIPKNLIGDPQKGDILTHTFVKTFMEFTPLESPFLAIVSIGQILAVDLAFGNNYQIQY